MKTWNCYDLDGEGTRYLDKISIDSLTEADRAMTYIESTDTFYIHVFDASSTDANSSPSRIRPFDYSTAGVWHMIFSGSSADLGEMPGTTEKTGEIVGGDISMNSSDSTNDVDFGKIVCKDSANTSIISTTSTWTKRLDANFNTGTGNGGLLDGTVDPKAATTIYHLYAILNGSTVDFCFLEDGKTLATYLDNGTYNTSGYDKFRWLGFIRTNGANAICHFTMNGDLIGFGIASENVVSTGITTSYAAVDHTAFIPQDRIKEIEYGARDGVTSTPVIASDDGGNSSSFMVGHTNSTTGDNSSYTWSGTNSQKGSMKPYLSTREFEGSAGTVDLLIQGVIVKR